MYKRKFRFDLGQGDISDVTIEKKEPFTLVDMINDIKEAGEWFILGDIAMQTISIKRVVELTI